MKIYIIRHGETAANKEGQLQGWIDDPLNESGVDLAEVTGREMKKQGIRFDGCISSPLCRARETAEIVLRESGNGDVEIEFDDRLREIHMGDWERKHFKPEYGECDPEKIYKFFFDPFNFEGCPNGESVYQLIERTQAALRDLAAREGAEDQTWLLSTHGCATRAIMNFLYDDPSDFWQGKIPFNCSVSILEAEGGKIRLLEKDKIYYDPALCVDRYAQ